MNVYCWSVLPADTSQVPALMGVALSREHAQQAAGAGLRGDGGAFLALVEEARAALAVAGLGERYQRTGAAWTGRRTRGDCVHWTERPVPAAEKTAAREGAN